jgi:hypothetical protein
MATFPGGSAFAFAKDIADGYQLVTERSFKNFSPGELDQLALEFDKTLREARGDNAPTDDMQIIKTRNRRIQRLNTAMMILRNYRARLKR